MRRAGHKRPASVRAIPATLPSHAEDAVAIADAPVGNELPCDQKISGIHSEVAGDDEAHHRAREITIRQRIESRLPGRVRNLCVRSFDALVILEGQCATYYTKQLAQHAAMGVLEEEHLENAIVVQVE